MTAGVPKVGFYFMNGIMNDDNYGNKTTENIQSIIQKAPHFQSDKHFVTFKKNDAAPSERVLMELALSIGGAAAVVHSLNKEFKNEGNEVSKVVGVIGVLAIAGAAVDYKKMQDDKNRIALDLKNHVTQFLDENDFNVVNLLFHSQGADVGYRTLETLDILYRSRIRVITLGAMTTIPDKMCAIVINYKFTNDWISRLLALPFEKMRETTDNMGERTVVSLNREGVLIHGVHEYLEEKLVQDSILSLLS